MIRTKRLAIAGVLASFTLLAAACGDDDTTSTTAPSTVGGGASADLPACLDFADLYALTGPESDGIDNWADAQALAAELGSVSELPDAPLVVAGPGTESGTYDTFVEFIFDDVAEERGVESGARGDYLASPNDNVIVDNLTSSDGSLGWVGFAFFIQSTDELRAFELSHLVDGVGCTAPTPETIANGDYPLSRPLYLYVNNAKAETSGTLSEYVDLYLGDLYECVVDAGYVALTDEALADTVDTWTATGFSGRTDDGSELDISGSSTVEPISACVLDETGFTGSVEGPGTGDGFARFCAGETDISDASRAIKDSEAETCAANGVEYTELVIAIDGIAVMTAI